jgi:hypothetical protein
MTNKMIDADALDNLFEDIFKKSTYNIMGVEYVIDKAILINILHRIKELATPAPAPQESIFDINKWQNYLETNGHEGVLYKILFGNEKTLKLIPSCNGQKILNAFDDDNFNPLKNELHKNIFICLDLDVKDFLCEPQESIFDADGWCWNMDKAPRDETRILGLTSFGAEVVKYHNEKNIYYGDNYFQISIGWVGCEQDSTCFPEIHNPLSGIKKCQNQPIAWQPLPTISTGGKE